MDCCDFLKQIPDDSVQLICIDPPYNLELAGWDSYDNYIEWAAQWLDEAYRVLAPSGNMVYLLEAYSSETLSRAT